MKRRRRTILLTTQPSVTHEVNLCMSKPDIYFQVAKYKRIPLYLQESQVEAVPPKLNDHH